MAMRREPMTIIRLAVVAAILAPSAPVAADEFSGERAFAHLEALCGLGPRPSGSDAMAAQRRLLTDHFRGLGGVVTPQPFQIRDRHTGETVRMENLIVTWHPDRMERVLLAAHYDTRPWPDRDPKEPRGRFVGANDGASGTALLMEMARSMGTFPGPLGVDFVLFDAEEYVIAPRDPYCLGSNWFARRHVQQPPRHTYRCGVVLDMVGDRNLQIFQERQSVGWPDTRWVVDSIWETAARLEVRQFVPRPMHTVEDDHVPLRMIARIPTCDVIDFDYPQWHTTQDLPENCSAESLEAVGRVMLEWLRSLE
jgi:glutaminyl-peptide cyclotransferase